MPPGIAPVPVEHYRGTGERWRDRRPHRQTAATRTRTREIATPSEPVVGRAAVECLSRVQAVERAAAELRPGSLWRYRPGAEVSWEDRTVDDRAVETGAPSAAALAVENERLHEALRSGRSTRPRMSKTLRQPSYCSSELATMRAGCRGPAVRGCRGVGRPRRLVRCRSAGCDAVALAEGVGGADGPEVGDQQLAEAGRDVVLARKIERVAGRRRTGSPSWTTPSRRIRSLGRSCGAPPPVPSAGAPARPSACRGRCSSGSAPRGSSL